MPAPTGTREPGDAVPSAFDKSSASDELEIKVDAAAAAEFEWDNRGRFRAADEEAELAVLLALALGPLGCGGAEALRSSFSRVGDRSRFHWTALSVELADAATSMQCEAAAGTSDAIISVKAAAARME
jgi:hypothetical protein